MIIHVPGRVPSISAMLSGRLLVLTRIRRGGHGVQTRTRMGTAMPRQPHRLRWRNEHHLEY